MSDASSYGSGSGHGHLTTLYGVTIHHAIGSGDLGRLRALEAQAEALLKEADEVRGALGELKAEIARLEGGNR